jgi:hypothetical protein
MIATFDLELESDVSATIQPALHAVVGAEEEYQSMIWQVHDANRRVVAEGVGREGAGRLDEGSYTVRLHVRHDDADLLERISEMPLIVDMEMRNINLSCYQSPADLGVSRYGRRDLAVGDAYPSTSPPRSATTCPSGSARATCCSVRSPTAIRTPTSSAAAIDPEATRSS